MDILRFDIKNRGGKFKIMNAVNNGPQHKRHANNQPLSNLSKYKAAGIPYARNHDASFYAPYGGEHTVDISAIFPDFDAPVDDPASYDFACTDEYILVTLEAGTQTFYRLGQKIEHTIKKFHTHPPKDFKKWAQICEHIIRHYNEGWANGYNLNIEYWEIWNEPDMMQASTWSGTQEEFFDLYEITAKHLKACFPDLKIGGPALAYKIDWAEEFLCEMQKRQVPMDFFSWHCYTIYPSGILYKAETFRGLLDKYGYAHTESILDEWAYIKNFYDDYVESLRNIAKIKGATYVMAVMCEGQHSNALDMLMYYDARPCSFNCLFTSLGDTLKGYYPFQWYSYLYNCEAEIRVDAEPEGIYTLCGVDKDDKITAIVTYYDADDNLTDKTIYADFGKKSTYEIYLVDEEHDGELIGKTDNIQITLKPNSFILIKEV